jgi:hypothetical protein
MRAALYWLLTGEITFATLKSKQPTLSDSEKAQDPLPVSPKSLYALAHYLGSAALCEIALSNYERQLDKTIIHAELVSELFLAHEPVRDMVLPRAASILKGHQWAGKHYAS